MSNNPSDPKKLDIPETKLSASEVEDRLVKARIKMLLQQPFFGNLATRLRFIDATNWCPTAATDGRNFYYNRNFVAALSDNNLIWLAGHEVLHCVYDHLDVIRLGNRDKMIANIAQDFVINLDLEQNNIGERITLIKVCYDTKYREHTWEEVYDDLIKNAKKINMSTVDVHMSGAEGDDEGDGKGSDKDGDANDGKNGPIKYSKSERERIKQEMKSAVIQSAQAAGAGNLPGGVKRIIDSLLNPKLDWRELLAMQIQSTLKNNYTWMVPSKKGMDAGIYLPSMDRDQTIDIAIGIDTSGSISDNMLRDFLSEVYGIMSQYDDFTLWLWCFDTEVHNPVKFTSDTMHDFMSYKLDGFGGTLFEANWDFMKEENILPKKFVMFTDGYPCGTWGDEIYTDTLFIVHGGSNGKTPIAPFGITVPYTQE